MSNYVDVVVRKEQAAKTYRAGPCECGKCEGETVPGRCEAGDWQYGIKPCCEGCIDQPLCSKPDLRLCPAGGKGVTSAEFVGTNGDCGIMRCFYNGDVPVPGGGSSSSTLTPGQIAAIVVGSLLLLGLIIGLGIMASKKAKGPVRRRR